MVHAEHVGSKVITDMGPVSASLDVGTGAGAGVWDDPEFGGGKTGSAPKTELLLHADTSRAAASTHSAPCRTHLTEVPAGRLVNHPLGVYAART